MFIPSANCLSWDILESPPDAHFHSVYMLDSNDGWAVGLDGLIARWNGVSWNTVPSPTTEYLRSVCMVDANDGWVVTYDGAIIRWNGVNWYNFSAPNPQITGLFSVDMVNENDGWAVGGGLNVLQWDGYTWSAIPKSTGQWFWSVSMVDSNDGWAVGTNGATVHWDGTYWSVEDSPTTAILTEVSMIDSNDGWAVGYGGTIIHWDGVSWTSVTSPTTEILNAVFMLNSDDGWAVGDGGTIIHWDGVSWTSVTSPTTGFLTSVYALDYDEAWILGMYGTILQLTEKPPIASFTYSPDSPMVGEEIIFDGSASYDPDGSIRSYFWEFADAITGSVLATFSSGFFGSVDTVPFSFSNTGLYNVTLTVMDNSNRTDSITRQVNVIQEFDLTIINEGSAGVTSLSAGTHSYPEGTAVEVLFTHIADGTWVFDNWLLDGANAGSADSIIVTMDDNHVLTAVSHQQYAFLRITTEGEGTTSPPPTIDSYRYDIGTQRDVTATPSDNWELNHWELDGINVGNANPYIVNLDESHLLTAVFQPILNPPSFELTVEVVGQGFTNPSTGSYRYEEGERVLVEAVPESDWSFTNWELDGSNVGTSDSYTVLMDRSHVLKAIFTEKPSQQYRLTVDVDGSGSTDPGVGVHSYDAGSSVTVTAYPPDGWALDCWMLDGQNIGSDKTITCSINADSSLTAMFTEIPVPLIPPELVPPIVGGGAAAATGLGTLAYQKYIRKPNGKKSSNKEKTKEKEHKKLKKTLLKLSISDCPKSIVANMSYAVKLKVSNVGLKPAKEVLVFVYSTPELNLENVAEKIPEIAVSKDAELVFKFKTSKQIRRGTYKLRFVAKAQNSLITTGKDVTLHARKLGLLGTKNEQKLSHVKNWLRGQFLSWDDLTSAENVLYLLGYDLIIVSSELEMSAKWAWVLRVYVDNGGIMIKTQGKKTVEKKIINTIFSLFKS